MKRLFLILLVALLLTGCQPEEPPATEPPQTTEGDTTNSLYMPGSYMEQQTGGAVLVFDVAADTYTGIYSIGANILLAGQNQMTVLTAESGEVLASAGAEGAYSDLVVSGTGVSYYLPDTKQIVICNQQLYVSARLQMPEAMVGEPVICSQRNEAYYSVGSEIHALDMGTGVSRLLRQQTVGALSVEDIHFDGTVLACRYTNEAGQTSDLYISTETGATVSQAQLISGLHTFGDRYFLEWKDASVNHTICGARNAEPMSFLATLPAGVGPSGRRPLLAMNGLVDYVETTAGLEFIYYDLTTGKNTAYLQLPKLLSPRHFYSDGTYVWFLATDAESTKEMLYRWDVTKSPCQNDVSYTTPLYTAENPDTEGIAQCKSLADTYSNQYGLKLRIWQDAISKTGGHTVTVEYHPNVIREFLEKLQPALTHFPPKFLQKTVEKGWVRVCLVRSIDDGAAWKHFWEAGDCWILIASDADPVDAFYQGLAYAIDSHVLGNSRDFDADRWSALNPEGFVYAYSYQINEKIELLVGADRAFTDRLAMSYPHEDRCRIFYNAMLPDNAEMFRSPVMQAKLLQLCRGIREGYNLEKSPDTYLWEQYLQVSLAYEKK